MVSVPKEGHISWRPDWQLGVKTWSPLSKTSRIGKPTRRKVEICFGSVLFSLDEWILCSDNQNLQSTCPMDKVK